MNRYVTGTMIRQLREQKNMTQEELAEKQVRRFYLLSLRSSALLCKALSAKSKMPSFSKAQPRKQKSKSSNGTQNAVHC